MARCWALLAALLLLTIEVSVQAAEQADRAGAEALFKEGLTLVKAGDFEQGCPKFDAALKLWASASTAINLAHCHKHFKRDASAWKAYRQALSLASDIEDAERKSRLQERARGGMSEVEPRLALLKLNIKPSQAMSDDVTVEYAGISYPSGHTGAPFPVKPGSAMLSIRAPGYAPYSNEVEARLGETNDVIVALAAESDALGTIPLWSWIAGAGGLAFGAVSVGFLVDYLDAVADLKAGCDTAVSPAVCTPGYDVFADNRRKNRSLGLSVGFGVASAAALAAAIVGIAASDAEADAAIQASGYLGPGLSGAGWSGGVSLGGRF